MRHYKMIMLIMLLCMLLPGCTERNSTTATIEDCIRKDGSMCFSTFEAYDALIHDVTLPSTFVYYEDIEQFGTFVSLSIFYPHDKDQLYFVYTLIDDAEIELDLIFTSNNFITGEILTEDNVNPSDMRRAKKEGIYEYHGVFYEYWSQGTLSRVFWCHNGVYCIIDTTSGLKEYPYKQHTSIAKLLNIEEKSEKDIQTILAGKTTARDILHPILHYVPLTVFLGAVMVFFILRRCKKTYAV